MATRPPIPSFIEAAREAIERSGNLPADMGRWTAASAPSSALCAAEVERSDVYVGIIGFRYGSVSSNDPIRSYVELEYETARRLEIPTLVFIIAEDLSVPVSHSFHVGEHSEQQMVFRRRILAETVCGTVSSPAELESRLGQALNELMRKPQLSDAPGLRRPMMVPPRLESFIPRHRVTTQLLEGLLGEEKQAIALTTALQGAGGFGKTTLASEICRRQEVQARFPDGILWATIGENLSNADLANKVNDLSEALSGRRPTFADPEQAGFHLGQLLGAERRLLVIDDVWRTSQLDPFLAGGPGCVRLITTRNRSIVPTSAKTITVDAMEAEEARQLLTCDLQGMATGLAESLLRQTGRWPVLMSLVNGSIRRFVRDGDTVDNAARRVWNRLSRRGPSALDVTKPESRRGAVAATVEASLTLLEAEQLDRYMELGIFGEDAEIPTHVLAILWAPAGGVDEDEAEDLCSELSDLSLLRYQVSQKPTVRLHDVLRTYIRGKLDGRLRELNVKFLAAASTKLGITPEGLVRWWDLPEDHYLWEALGYHLKESNRIQDLVTLIADGRWVAAKLMYRGPAAVEADFGLVSNLPEVQPLRTALGQAAHLLGPISPSGSLVSILASRLELSPEVSSRVLYIAEERNIPRLINSWRLPDGASPQLRRVLHGHTGMIWSCSVTHNKEIVSVGDFGQIRIWDSATGTATHQMIDEHGALYASVVASTGGWLAAGGQGGGVRIWDIESGHLRVNLNGDSSSVYGISLSADERWLAACGENGFIRVWDLSTKRLARLIDGSASGTFYDCCFAGDGRFLVTASEDGRVRVWDAETGRLNAELDRGDGSVLTCVVSDAGGWISSAGYDGSMRIWNSRSLDLLRVIRAGDGAIYDCCAGPGGKWVATAGEDRTVRVWDIETGALSREFVGHTGYLGACAADPFGDSVVSAGNDGTLRIWDLGAREGEDVPTRSQNRLSSCSGASDSAMVLTGGREGCLEFREPLQGGIESATAIGRSIEALTISRAGNVIAVGGEDGWITLLSAAGGQLHAPVKAHRGWILDCSFDEAGETLVTTGIDGAVKRWNLASGRLVGVLRADGPPQVQCQISPDGRYVGVCGYENQVTIVELDSGHSFSVGGVGEWLHALSWEPLSDAIWAGGESGRVYHWRVIDGSLTAVLDGHSGAVTGCAVHPDGDFMATVAEDCSVRIWDLSSGKCSVAMRSDGALHRVCWIPNSRDVVISGDRGVYRFTFVNAMQGLILRQEELGL
jgi:WD40 repeat protein